MKSLDEKIHEIINHYLFYIGVGMLILSSILIRCHLAPICILSADYNNCIALWVEYYRSNGLAGLSTQIGDYYVPYNLFLALISYLPWEPWVMVSLFSSIFDYIAAYYIYKISLILIQESPSESTGTKKAIFAGITVVLLPLTFLNSDLWKQCDSIYVCFMIIALYYILKEKYGTSMLFLGISFCFKLQAIFLFPLFVILYIGQKKKLSILHFMIIPLSYLIGGFPAVLAGRRITNVYGTYYHQIGHEGYNAMTINFSNLFGLGLSDYPALSMPFTLLTLCIFILFACFLQHQLKSLCNKNIIYIALWCIWTCTMFLPGMHERYNYAVVLLATAFYIVTDLNKIWIAVVLNLISIVLYSTCLFGQTSISLPVLSIFYIITYAYATYDLVNKLTVSTKKNI